MDLSRRHSLTLAFGAALATALPRAVWAAAETQAKPRTLSWADLLPDEGASPGEPPAALQGIVPHGALTAPAQSEKPRMREDLNGVLVRIPGYALPLEMENVGVTEFLLVPYIGACVHVPPPPANQMVMVHLNEPMIFEGLFEPVWVTGPLQTKMTQVGGWIDIGYRISAEDVTAYEFPK